MTRWLVAGFLGFGFACGNGDGERRPPPVAGDARAATDGAVTDAAVAAAPLEPPVAVPAPKGPYRGPDCRKQYAPRPDRDDAPMCFEPGGVFLMGSPEREGDPAEHPQRRVTLSPFFIDQFEVTREQFARFLSEAPHGLRCNEIGPNLCPGGGVDVSQGWALDVIQGGKVHKRGDRLSALPLQYRVRPGEERIAMNEVTIEAARAYCSWVGKELPTNARWEYAGRVEPLTGKLRKYPWGDRFEPEFVSCAPNACDDDDLWLRAKQTVDEYPRDRSASGVRGLGSNVDEWVTDCATESIPDCGECVDPVAPPTCEPRVVQVQMRSGGSYSATTNAPATRGGTYLSNNVPLAWRNPYGDPGAFRLTGLRCVTSAIKARPGGSGPSR